MPSNVRARMPLWLVLSVCTLVGGYVRFQGLDTRDFWFDESCSFIYVHYLFDWPADSNLLVESTNLPYYVLLRGWTSLFGDSEAAYRSLSALATTLVVPILGLLTWRLAGASAAIVCATLAALNPLQVYYAHEARAYALWTLILALMLWLLCEAARRDRARWWIAYGLIALLALHLHYYTIFWLAGSVICVVIGHDRRRVFKHWLITTVLIGVGFVPYFVAAVMPATRGGGSAWIAPHWEPTSAFFRSLWAFLPAGEYPAHLRGLSLLSRDTVHLASDEIVSLTRNLPAIVILIAVYVAVRQFIRPVGNLPATSPLKKGTGAAHVFVVGLTVIPLLLPWIYSVLVRPIYLVGRYDLVAWPAATVWIAMLIVQAGEALRPRLRASGAALITVALLACSLLPLARMAALKPGSSFPHVRAERLAECTAAGDLVIALTYDREFLLYYLHRAGFAAEIVSFPSWLDGQIGWVDTEGDLARVEQGDLQAEVALMLAKCNAQIERGARVWLLADSTDKLNTGPRSLIHNPLFQALRYAGYEAVIVDSETTIRELRRSEGSDQPPGAYNPS